MRSFGSPAALLGALLPTVAVFGLVEAGLRLAGVDLAIRPLEVRAGEVGGGPPGDALRPLLESRLFEPDPEAFWRPKPGEGPFNAAGYRGPVVGPKRPGERRILAVGDSNTLGHAISWVDELARLDPSQLDARSLSVVNLGVYGYTSYQGKLRLRRFLPLEPDVVLISFGGNDAAPNVVADASYRGGHDAWWLGKLRLVDGLQRLAMRLQRAASPPAETGSVPRVSLADYSKNLTEMVANARERGATPILLTRPFVDPVYEEGSNRPVQPYRAATFTVGERLGVPVIDVDAIADRQASLFDDHSHFSPRGHGIVGERIGRALVAVLATGTYPADELRYVPSDVAERASNALYRLLDPFRSLDDNLARLARESGRVPLGRPSEVDLADPAARLLRHPPGTAPAVRDGRLCFPISPGQGVQVAVPLAAGGARLIWLEPVRPPAELAVRLTWSDGATTHEDVSVSSVFRPTGTPLALAAVVPEEARQVEATFFAPSDPFEACLRRVTVVPIAGDAGTG